MDRTGLVSTDLKEQPHARAAAPDPFVEGVRRLFRRARRQPPRTRDAWVDVHAADPETAAAVRALLAHDIEAGEERDVHLGHEIAGWMLLEVIGEGGSGRVYLATRAGARGALKLLHTKHSGSGGAAGHRLGIERSALERLDHPAIVRLLDHGSVEIGGVARDWLVTEFIEEAEPLIEGAMRDQLDLPARIGLLATVAEAVGYAHAAGVVHRDLKPDNIVLDGHGRPRILDFGIAMVTERSATDRDRYSGSRATLAPEQADSTRGPITPRTDVYALGFIGYRLLTGEPPYRTGSTLADTVQAALHVPPADPRLLEPSIPDAVAEALLRALRKDPAGRFPDARAFVAALRRRASRSAARTGLVLAASGAVLATGVALLMTTDESRFHAPPQRLPHDTGDPAMTPMFATSLSTSAAITAIGMAATGVPDIVPMAVIPIQSQLPEHMENCLVICDEDIVYVRPADRSIRVLREGPDGTWNEFALPGQGTPAGTSLTRIVGQGDLLAASFATHPGGGDRVEIFERSATGAWIPRQVITAPNGGTFQYPDAGDWSGDRLIVPDRFASCAYVFGRQPGGEWVQESKLQGTVSGEVWDAKLDGDLAVVGHWLNPCGYSGPSGTIAAYRRSASGTWSLEGNLRPATATCGDYFGTRLMLGHGRYVGFAGGASHRFYQWEHGGAGWQQIAEMPPADEALSDVIGVNVRTSWGFISRTALNMWAMAFIDGTFRPIGRTLPPPGTAGQQPYFTEHLGANSTRCASLFNLTAGGAAITVYDLSHLLDCDGDGIPNAEEIAAGAADCDADGIPDSCEDSGEYVSPTSAPFGFGQPLSHTFGSLPTAADTVNLVVEVTADLGGLSEFVTVKVDGVTLATLFGVDGQDCPAGPQSRTIPIPAAQFNGFLADGPVTVELLPSTLVSTKECPGSSARVSLAYPGQLRDCDGNGESDACQIAADPGLDKNADGTLDSCNYAKGDFDLSGSIDAGDIAYLLALWGSVNPPVGDLDGDHVVTASDLAALLANWGPIKP